MEAHLEWRDVFLVLVAGPWVITVADIETYGSGAARAYLRGWLASTDYGTSCRVPGDDHPRADDEEDVGVLCRSKAEAVAVIRALLAVRGVDCPPAPE